MNSTAHALLGGLLHPLLAPGHVVALVGLAVATGRAGLRAVTVAAFVPGLIAGLGALAWGVGETPAPDVLLALTGLCGIFAAGLPRVPAWLAVALAPVVGVAVGLDSPPEVTSLKEAVLMLLGTACGGAVAFAVLAVAASALRRVGRGIVLRIAGSWVASIAILVLALRWTT
jgi:urease accessory protein